MKPLLIAGLALLCSLPLRAQCLPPGSYTISFQAGGAGASVDARTRSCYFREATGGSGLWTDESSLLSAHPWQGFPLVEFTELVGCAPDRIPQGAIITSATLSLWCTSVSGSTNPASISTLSASAVLDLDRLGPWHEPETPGQATGTGATYIHRDSRHDRGWKTSGTTAPTTTFDPPFDLPEFNPTVRIYNGPSPAPAGTLNANEWHSWDVATVVQLWAEGFSNQGWMIKSSWSGTAPHTVSYASDDHPDPTRRPKLEVSFIVPTASPTPFNTLPEPVGPSTATVIEGTELSLFLTAADPDPGPGPVEIVITEVPAHGELRRLDIGGFEVVTYLPEPGFVGSDRIRWFVRDWLSTSSIRSVDIDVQASSGTHWSSFQKGVLPTPASSAAFTRSCGSRIPAGSSTSETSYEDEILQVREPGTSSGRLAWLEFPNLFGNGNDQIPPGATILGAELFLTLRHLSSSASEDAVIAVRRVIDPLDRGSSWAEPLSSCTYMGGGCNDAAVSWSFPDASSPGQAWDRPGGDVLPEGGASVRIPDTHVGSGVFRAEVSEALRAWSRGEPNHGWRLRSNASDNAEFWADDAPDPSLRPRLVVRWREPTAAPLPLGLAPLAKAGPDRQVFASQRITLDASDTTHPGGDAFSVLWLAPPGIALSNPTALRPTFIAPALNAGQHQDLDFQLIAYSVHSGETYATSDSLRIQVVAQPGGSAHGSPQLDAGPDISVPELTLFSLSASATPAPGGGTLSWRWTKLEGAPLPTTSGMLGPNPTITSPATGAGGGFVLFDLALTQTFPDGFQSTAHDTLRVNVQQTTNGAPTAVPGYRLGPGEGELATGQTPESGVWVTLDGGASHDPENHPLLYRWSQVPNGAPSVTLYGTQDTADAVRTPFRVEVGSSTTFLFELLVNDGELTHSAQISITIAPPQQFQGSLFQSPLTPYGDQLSLAETRHLLRRMGEGWHPTEVSAAKALGLSGVLAQRFAPGAQDTPAAVLDEALEYAPLTAATAFVPSYYNGFDPYKQYNQRQVESMWVVHSLRSPAMVRERFVRFLHDRFAVSGRSLGLGKRHWMPAHLVSMRNLAFADFGDFLRAFVQDPVTLSFIDGFENVFTVPNENFAREFFELHTLGVFDPQGNRIYDEANIRDAARAFTGFQPVCFPQGSGGSCYAVFVPQFHDPNANMVVLPGLPPAHHDHQSMVDAVLAYNGGVDASRWLAEGLLRAYVVNDPPQSLVDQLGAAIRGLNWNLGATLELILRSRAFFSPEAALGLVKNPVDWTNGIARTLEINLQTSDLSSTSVTSVLGQLEALGQSLSNPDDVDGWPEDLSWIDEYSLIRRSEVANFLLQRAITPSVPQGGVDYPGIPAVAASLLPDFLPPPKARKSLETATTLAHHLDLRLTSAELQLAANFLDHQANAYQSNPYPTPPSFQLTNVPFDADQPGFETKAWSLVLLFLAHPDGLRL